MQISKRKTKGLTLIELIAVLALTPLILAAIYQTMVVGYRLLNNGNKLTNVQEGAKVALSTLTQQLKNARFYLDTEDVTNDSRFDSFEASAELVCYIEGYDGNRYLYTIETSGTKRQLYLHTLSPIKLDVYEVETKEYKMSNTQFNDYSSEAKYSTNKIPFDATRVKNMPSGYTGEFLFYDDYDWQMYLVAQNYTTLHYSRFPLKSIPDSDVTDSPQKIMSYIDSISVVKDPSFTGEGSNKKCKVYIKAVDGGKTKELTADVFTFEKI